MEIAQNSPSNAPAPGQASIEDRLMSHIDKVIKQPLRTQDETYVKHEPTQEGKVEETPEPVAETAEAAEPAKTEPEHYEFEFNGAKYQVPPELKELHEGYQRQQDYTKKTQETAEMRRSAELMMQQANTQMALRQALEPHLEELIVVNKQLKLYQQVDWNQLTNSDAQEAQKHFMAYQQLKDRKAGIEGDMHKAANDHVQKLNETRQKLKTEGDKILTQKVKGWNPEKSKALSDFATKTYGFSDNEVSQWTDPRVMQLVNDANEWHAFQAAKPKAEVKVPSKTLRPNASDGRDGKSTRIAEIKRDIRSAKTDTDKAKNIQRLLEQKLG
jgi:hypothetical protein